ncbi:MAG: hypothetical protein HGB10_01475 [Coriobacteriia bacterium]|nr:hypothetical protein [Coriobacteriia bacterium]
MNNAALTATARRDTSILVVAMLMAILAATLVPQSAHATGTLLANGAGAPDISGSQVVWNQVTTTGGLKYYIYTRNLSTGQTAPLTSGQYQSGIPRIQGDRVVFDEFQFATPVSMSLVFGIALNSGLFFAAPNTGAFAPDVNGKWVTYTSSGNWAYLVDTTTNDEWQLSTGTLIHPQYGLSPVALTNKYAFWSDSRVNGNADILSLELGTSGWGNIDPTEPAGNQYDPAAEGDWVVWTDDRNGTEDIYAWNMATNTGRAIAPYASNQRSADVSWPLVVWTDYRTGNGDIYARDLVTGQTTRVTTEDVEQRHPAISGNRLVWEQSGSQVYYKSLGSRTVSVKAPTKVRKRKTAKLTGIASGYAGARFASTSITLQRSYTKKSWTNIKSGKTTSTGTYSISTPALTRKAYWRVRLNGPGVTLYTSPKSISVY